MMQTRLAVGIGGGRMTTSGLARGGRTAGALAAWVLVFLAAPAHAQDTAPAPEPAPAPAPAPPPAPATPPAPTVGSLLEILKNPRLADRAA